MAKVWGILEAISRLLLGRRRPLPERNPKQDEPEQRHLVVAWQERRRGRQPKAQLQKHKKQR